MNKPITVLLYCFIIGENQQHGYNIVIQVYTWIYLELHKVFGHEITTA